LEANQEKSEIVAKLEDAERKAQMAAKTEANSFIHSQRTINDILDFSVDNENGTDGSSFC
jgi:hypothetical protein